MLENQLNRREFLKQLALLIGGVTILGRTLCTALAQKPTKPADSPALKLIDPNDPTAKALLYTHDAVTAPADKRVEKMGVAGKDQFCDNCQFYIKKGVIGGHEVGQCQLLTAGMVYHHGWCFGWGEEGIIQMVKPL